MQHPPQHAGPGSNRERRDRVERRRRVWWSLYYGSINPRRRSPARRSGDTGVHSVDWHSSHLLAVSIGILIMCIVDALLTLVLLQRGAVEVNPLMARLVYGNVAMFATLKMAMTSAGVVLMVYAARYRFMRLLLVEWVLYGVLIAYTSLILYEISLIKGSVGEPIL